MLIFVCLPREFGKMNRRIGLAVAFAIFVGLTVGEVRAEAAGESVVSQGLQSGAPAQAAPQNSQTAPVDNSPEAIMGRRFPQKVRVGDLIGLPMLDDNDVTLGHVERVVRTPEGKIKLIVGYSKWFGWFGRPVAVPIEVVAILGRQIASVDMPPAEYAAAPTWTVGKDMAIPDNDIIRIAITRR
jgi:hypothetical protein